MSNHPKQTETRHVYPERDYQTLHEFIHQARLNLPQTTWDYLTGSSETETTQVRNRLAIESLAFRPRVLRDVSSIDTSGDVLGKRMRLPVILAPIGSLESFTEEGALAPAKVAEDFGCDHMLSSACQPGLEEVAGSVTAPSMYQLYVRGDRAFVDDVGHRAIAAGYRSFCFTVDTAVYSRRERDMAKRYLPRGRARAWAGGANTASYQSSLSWADIEAFKAKHDIPVSLKGIATGEDARIAVQHGVEAVYISNHGGRQLDQGLGSISLVQEIVDAVEGKAEVWVDGGFMRGSDIVKAIALGANAVGLGRLQGYALAAGGAPAMHRALEILEAEVKVALGLLGVTSMAELNPSHVTQAPPVPSNLNGLTILNRMFPHLDLNDPGY
jgi:isopentenyl diphosphate isomerase/L-lactate dehydrogenase-like FMN-dependent dehydrogenase